ncbi:hypothetical protein [Escherichia coli]|uniref:hypothetical protein n=1 Tax=Escherichia coli TaxID=562 RepID=UPI002811245A|nr:hypothetical protein [Escherichia coli]
MQVLNPQRKAFLDMVAWSEGTDNGRQPTRNHGYDVIVGGELFTDYSDQQAISDYINSLMIGDSVLLSRIYSPANLGVVSGGNARYYDIQELTIGKSPGALSPSNIDIRYNESASCTPENIVITVES